MKKQNAYALMKQKQQKEIDAFPIGACFSNQQFADMMAKWGLTVNDTDKITSLGAGCYIRKSDVPAFNELFERHLKERENAIANDASGDGFIYDMFIYELANHEYCITYDYEDTFFALGLSYKQVARDKRLLHGLKKAEKDYLKSYNNL